MSVTSPILVLRLFSAEECERAVELARTAGWGPAQCGGYAEGYVKASTAALPEGRAMDWLGQRMAWAMIQANLRYKFDAATEGDVGRESVILRYEVGGRFDWHADNADFGERQRKISITVQLSAPRDYEGGDLEFMPGGIVGLSRQQGAAVVFPAFLCHRVRPVRRGERIALAGSLFGPPLR